MKKRHSVFAISILFGLNSLFADILYEGARSVIPPYLQEFGLSLVAVGFIVGLAEFIGYAVRLLSGYFLDRWKLYWTFLVIGYLGTITVPLMGMVTATESLVLLIFLERIAKGIRSPAKSTIISVLVIPEERGKAFGMIEVLDELGAMLGPFILFLVFLMGNGISFGLRVMFIFYVGVLALQLFLPYFLYGQFREGLKTAESLTDPEMEGSLGSSYWRFVISISVSFMFTFPIAINLVLSSDFLPLWNIPLLYLAVHLSDMLSAGIFGRLYRKTNLWVLYFPFILSPITLILLLSKTEFSVFVSALALGSILGIHESAVRARISDLSPTGSRGRGFGIFYFAMGISSFLSNFLFSLIETSPLSWLFGIGAIMVQVFALRSIMGQPTQ
ncbi:MAG: MFS transporter [Methanobacteriota archaeon]|nr:MAG: MFS transporter [Euryarchaeota archaeon]